jgi:D-alanine-D-alanine ligase
VSERRPDVVFNLVESLAGQDSLAHLVPALLDVLGVPYTGASTEALFLTNNKLLTKRLLRQAGLPTPDWHVAQKPTGCNPWASESVDVAMCCGTYVLKTVTEHASYGLEEDSIVRAETPAALQAALQTHSARLGRACYAEQYIDGREFNLSVLAGPQEGKKGTGPICRNGPKGASHKLDLSPFSPQSPQVLPPAEIDFSGFPPGKPRLVGYRAKWEEGSFEFQHTPRRFDFPAEDGPLLDRLREVALSCWRVFGLRGYGRVDFRVDEAGRPWVLEINTNPCLSPDAGFYAALQRASLHFQEGIARILHDAILLNEIPNSKSEIRKKS